ncbi:hypothetical protein AM500_03540 [Bacillus sp. FJAT-18017]|uniref:reverse transcriptase-like protein n=1 Tax=Bacillus sp. FJAT-18017 TaxID=1705566 RepID=UPI0006AE7FE3|nr:reverse transcriptase-like protein [Bacillus sp. FJAT-18017]ALC88975.1 hypothetical protein AM500_03540 [Bacillus sp. FJAT-18017]
MTNQETPEVLLQRKEIQTKLTLSKAELNMHIREGMPHYFIANQYRFLESEVKQWLEACEMQKELEKEFLAQKGKSNKYVTDEILIKTLGIEKERLPSLRKTGMPFKEVGFRYFYPIKDVLNYFGRGTPTESILKVLKKKQLTWFENVPVEVPILIVDGSYSKSNKAGSGIVTVENRKVYTGHCNVRNIVTKKSETCEFLAIMDALELIKERNFKKSIIFTDQKKWVSEFVISEELVEDSIKPLAKMVNQLRGRMKGKVEIRYVGMLYGGKNNLLYLTAHKYSREYNNKIYQNLQFE